MPHGMASVTNAAFRFRRRACRQKPPRVSMSKRPAMVKSLSDGVNGYGISFGPG
jgi:hypothetical protein